MQEPTIFSRIVSGEVPAHKVYEDDKTLAFMNIHPSVEGHVLVIPKAGYATNVWDLHDDDYQAVMATCKKVAARLREVLEVPRVGVKVIGVDVAYPHVHLVPFTKPEDFYNYESEVEPDHAALAALADKLRFS